MAMADERVERAPAHGATECPTCHSPAPIELKRYARANHLSSRELQVARCAASGSTNREIATHLGLNSRTVEGHLQRVYEKTGVNNRTRLAIKIQSALS
jgi:DNA-binding NarL/FixJ family response regulator